MLILSIQPTELFNDSTQEFVYIDKQELALEHSLLSIAKWEAKWHKPFLSTTDKTNEEIKDYIRCMTINKGVDPKVYDHLSVNNLEEILAYIEDSRTATTFTDPSGTGYTNRSIVTSELIYYWMTAYRIPFETEKWHINRLLTLIKICSIKNESPKKMSKAATYKQNNALNKARRQRLNSRG